MTRQPVYIEENKRPFKPMAYDQLHEPTKHIEETARLANSVETAKDPSKVRRTKDQAYRLNYLSLSLQPAGTPSHCVRSD